MKQLFSLFLMMLLISGCSKKTENEYMNMANDNWKKSNIPEAVKSYEELLKYYPEGAMAPKALMELGKLYQYKVDKRIGEKESLDKAIESFKTLYEKFPKSEEAPLALFMVGFIEANELKSYDQAREHYNLFIEKYPNHSMVQNAKDELENLGLTPEQILNKKISENN